LSARRILGDTSVSVTTAASVTVAASVVVGPGAVDTETIVLVTDLVA